MKVINLVVMHNKIIVKFFKTLINRFSIKNKDIAINRYFNIFNLGLVQVRVLCNI